MMDYLQFGVEHPIFAACALVGITIAICVILEEIAGVVKAARGK